MVLLKIFDVDSENNETPLSVLQPGEHTLGRGSFSNCNDKRISRNHAVVRIEDNNVYLTPIHVNPCFYIPINTTSVTILPKDVPVQLSDGDKFAFLSEIWYRIKIINNEPNIIPNDNEIINNTEQQDIAIPSNTEIAISTDLGAVPSTETVDASRSSNDVSPLKRSLSELNATEGRKKLKTIEQSLDQLLDNFKSIESQDFPNGESDRKPGGVIKKNILTSDEDSDDDEGDNNEVTRDITILPRVDDDSSDEEDDDIINDVNKEPMDTNPGPNTQQETSVKTEDTDSCKQEPGEASTSTTKPSNPRRERCWYGKGCFRKNPSHRESFSHPGDSDYASDPEDNRPECAYGSQCYRTNVEHRRQYKHKNKRPAPKPSTRRKKRRLTNDTANSNNVTDSDDEDEEEPYESSGSEVSEPSGHDDDDDSDTGSDSSEADEKRMFKEAAKFLRKKKH